MVLKRMDFGGSRDILSGLPEHLICHILSFLPTEEAATTSVLAKKWRYLFAFHPDLHFDDSIYQNPGKEKFFMDFVDRVLALQGNSRVHKFSLKIENVVDPVRLNSWILNVLERRVSDIVLRMDLDWESPLPSKIFVSETLVTLKIKLQEGPNIDVEDVFLPKLKTLYIHSFNFKKKGLGLAKLLSGCPMLEELVLKDLCWYDWEFFSLCVTSLKRLKYRWSEHDENPKSVSFDTPKLVYLDYSENIADKYPKVNFQSLVEARIDLRMTKDQKRKAGGIQENDMVVNATSFIKAICNVKILILSADTLDVLTYCCEAIPLFNNLTHLTINSDDDERVGWESLPGLLKNSPNLETLVLRELVHRKTDTCGDVCCCKSYYGEEKEEIHTCLSSSPVKVLKVLCFGSGIELHLEIAQVKYFIETMPNLEQLIVYYNTLFDEDLIEVAEEIQSQSYRRASSKCNLKLFSDTICVSCPFG